VVEPVDNQMLIMVVEVALVLEKMVLMEKAVTVLEYVVQQTVTNS